MAASMGNRILNTAFKMAKVVSVLMAFLLLLAFVGALIYALMSWKSNGAFEQADFESTYNASVSGNQAADEHPSASSASLVDASNRVRKEYGDSVGDAMKKAGCSDQFEGVMQHLTRIAANEATEEYLPEVVKGAIKWYEDAAAMKSRGVPVNQDLVCGDSYWNNADEQIDALRASEEAGKAKLMTGLMYALVILFCSFCLMVIPAIYRIEESVRKPDV